jgi:signal transduction histidine kinase
VRSVPASEDCAAALETEPELVQVAGLSLLFALRNGRLEAELRSKTAELQTSRRRIGKIERDLHDGARQRLMSIQIKLALARERVDDPELASELDEIGEDATAAVDDLLRTGQSCIECDWRPRSRRLAAALDPRAAESD